MRTILNLKKEVKMLMKSNLPGKTGNSIKRVEKTKEVRFRELKNILAKFNKEYLFNNSLQNNFISQSGH